MYQKDIPGCRMVELIQKKLQEAGCRQIGVNYPGVTLFCKIQYDTCHVLVVADYRNPGESKLSTETLVSLKESVTAFLKAKGFVSINVVVLVVTYSEYLAEDLVDGRVDYWVADSYHNQFVIPAGQPASFGGFETIIRNAFYAETYPKQEAYVEPRQEQPRTSIRHQKKPKRNAIVNDFIIAVNIIIFIVLESKGSTLDGYFMLEHGAFFWPSIKIHGEIYRFLTCIFIHFGFSHLVNNMIVLYFLGDNLERAVGKMKYLIIYLVSGLSGSLLSCIYYLIIDEYVLSGGASGAIFGVIGALLYIVIINHGKLEDLKAFNLILLVVFSFYSGFTSTGVDNAAHVGGFLAGLILGKLLYKKPEQPIQNVESVSKMY